MGAADQTQSMGTPLGLSEASLGRLMSRRRATIARRSRRACRGAGRRCCTSRPRKRRRRWRRRAGRARRTGRRAGPRDLVERMSRSIPPPMPVIAPSTTAWTGGRGTPARSRRRRRRTARGPRRRGRRAGAASARSTVVQVRHDAGGAGGGEVAPVAKRLRRAADQQVAHDASGHADGHREHDDAERVEALAHAGDAAAEAEDERSHQVQGEDHVGVESRQHRSAILPQGHRSHASTVGDHENAIETVTTRRRRPGLPSRRISSSCTATCTPTRSCPGRSTAQPRRPRRASSARAST